uniref:Protein FAR1-RELATED SEQUENCE n=1 Tax=Aegilops tauschii subsp. strangulata TaxID=200361 RepID=A0A453C1S4_AEGTS
KQQRNRKSSRCGCQAYLRIGRDAGAGGLEWRVTGFSNHHNHELLRQDEMMRIMELEKCVQPGSLPFTEKDVRNLIHSFRRFELEEESVDLLQMCRNVKEKDPNFKYDFTKDANNCVENIAWSYASSIQSYELCASEGRKSAILHMGITEFKRSYQTQSMPSPSGLLHPGFHLGSMQFSGDTIMTGKTSSIGCTTWKAQWTSILDGVTWAGCFAGNFKNKGFHSAVVERPDMPIPFD